MGYPVLVTTENGVATVLLNRPETFNAFNLGPAGNLAHRLGKGIRIHKKHHVLHV